MDQSRPSQQDDANESSGEEDKEFMFPFSSWLVELRAASPVSIETDKDEQVMNSSTDVDEAQASGDQVNGK